MAKITVGQAQSVLAALARAATAGQPNVDRTGLGQLVAGAEETAQSSLYSEYQKKLQKEQEGEKGFLGDFGFIGDILSFIPGPQQPFIMGANALAHGAEAVQTGNVLEGLGAVAGGIGVAGSIASKAGGAANLAATSSGAMEATNASIAAASNAGSTLSKIGNVAQIVSPMLNTAAANLPTQIKSAPAAPAGLRPELAAQAAGAFNQQQVQQADMSQRAAQSRAMQAIQQQELGLRGRELEAQTAYQQGSLTNDAERLAQQRLADEAANEDRDAIRAINEREITLAEKNAPTPEERRTKQVREQQLVDTETLQQENINKRLEYDLKALESNATVDSEERDLKRQVFLEERETNTDIRRDRRSKELAESGVAPETAISQAYNEFPPIGGIRVKPGGTGLEQYGYNTQAGFQWEPYATTEAEAATVANQVYMTSDAMTIAGKTGDPFVDRELSNLVMSNVSSAAQKLADGVPAMDDAGKPTGQWTDLELKAASMFPDDVNNYSKTLKAIGSPLKVPVNPAPEQKAAPRSSIADTLKANDAKVSSDPSRLAPPPSTPVNILQRTAPDIMDWYTQLLGQTAQQ